MSRGSQRCLEPPPIHHCKGHPRGTPGRTGVSRDRPVAASAAVPNATLYAASGAYEAMPATRMKTPRAASPATNAAPAPATMATGMPSGRPLWARRKPLSAAAPAVTGRAAWSASPGRGRPRETSEPGRGERRAGARDPRHQSECLPDADRQVVRDVGLRASARRAVGQPERRTARQLRDGHRARSTQVALDRSLERESRDGGRKHGEGQGEGARTNCRRGCGERERRRRTEVQGHLEGLALGRPEPRVAPAEEPRDEAQVRGARHRHELGDPLDQPEGHGLAEGQALAQVVSGAASAAPRRRRLRTIR